MAERIAVDYDLQLASGGHVRLIIDTAHAGDHDKPFLLAVMDKVTEFARAASPDAPVVAPAIQEPPHEFLGQFGPTTRKAV